MHRMYGTVITYMRQSFYFYHQWVIIDERDIYQNRTLRSKLHEKILADDNALCVIINIGATNDNNKFESSVRQRGNFIEHQNNLNAL